MIRIITVLTLIVFAFTASAGVTHRHSTLQKLSVEHRVQAGVKQIKVARKPKHVTKSKRGRKTNTSHSKNLKQTLSTSADGHKKNSGRRKSEIVKKRKRFPHTQRVRNKALSAETISNKKRKFRKQQLKSYSKPICLKDPDGFCTSPVINYRISAQRPYVRLRLTTALGSVVSIQLPEGDSIRGTPAIGNGALFQWKIQNEPLSILLWPQIPEGSNATVSDLLGMTSNILISTSSGINLVAELKITAVSGVQKVILYYPEAMRKKLKNKLDLRAELESQIKAKYKDREENIEEEAKKIAMNITARGMLDRITCTWLKEREMVDLLVARASSVCQVGNNLYVKFSIQNRSKTFFTLQSIELMSSEGDEWIPLETSVEWQNKKNPQLKFDKSETGVIFSEITEETASSEYAIRIEESSGKKRVIILNGIEF